MGRINLYARRNVKLEKCLIFDRSGSGEMEIQRIKSTKEMHMSRNLWNSNRKEELESEISTQREPCKLAVT